MYITYIIQNIVAFLLKLKEYDHVALSLLKNAYKLDFSQQNENAANSSPTMLYKMVINAYI